MAKLNLTFSTNAGDLTDDFPENQPLHAIKRVVMGKLKLDTSQADQFCLTDGGNQIDEDKPIGELGLQPGAVIVLERCEAIKI